MDAVAAGLESSLAPTTILKGSVNEAGQSSLWLNGTPDEIIALVKPIELSRLHIEHASFDKIDFGGSA
jgi:hypothetical protein